MLVVSLEVPVILYFPLILEAVSEYECVTSGLSLSGFNIATCAGFGSIFPFPLDSAQSSASIATTGRVPRFLNQFPSFGVSVSSQSAYEAAQAKEYFSVPADGVKPEVFAFVPLYVKAPYLFVKVTVTAFLSNGEIGSPLSSLAVTVSFLSASVFGIVNTFVVKSKVAFGLSPLTSMPVRSASITGVLSIRTRIAFKPASISYTEPLSPLLADRHVRFGPADRNPLQVVPR